jgi:hypothetical protein
MNRKIVRLIGLTMLVGIVLLVGVVAVNAQGACVMHPLGDIVPCSHLVPTPFGLRALHAYDVIPCTHFIPCY